MKFPNLKVLTPLIFMILGAFYGFSADENREKCLDIHHQWLEEAYVLTKNCVGFSAPVSGRAYSYFSIGMYEGNVEAIPELNSLSGQLSGYSREVWADDLEKLNWRLVVNCVDFEMLRYLYRNMPPSNLDRISAVYESIRKLNAKKTSCRVEKLSIEYGIRLASEIIEWSKLDGADTSFEDNYPESFDPPQCISCWTKTAPGYLPSLLPYWGTNTPLLDGSQLQAENCKPFEFSIDSNSIMYQQALAVLDNSKKEDNSFEYIAEYWDDGAGYSGTPSGHFFTMSMQLVKKEELPLDKALELYVKLGVAVNEAFISAFSLKYKYNFIRPITYIQRYIDKSFNSRIASPPFPEFPSGHSFQSGAATGVMKSVFPDEISMIDSTNYLRSDIDGTPRSYTSLTEMSEEISISRFYGGIHFRETLDVSLHYGRKIGTFVAQKMNCRK